ncbi:MAG: bifunctional copper resistance protein CopD/cytochrome c oxidase assembly protein [Burkholderiaceae bacterium]|nr:bifunctional copper resistance protein CopD/cytochrome c oxidase assembly protein [Microbacteriaceae bacterium]
MSRLVRIAGPALLLVVSLLCLLAALQFGGGSAAPLIADPGAVVRYGLPISKLLVNLGAAATIGPLVLVCFALSRDRPEYDRALDFAAGAAAFWAVASAATGFFTFLNVYLQPFSLDAQFGELLGSFFTEVEFGQAWLATTLVAAATTVLCFAVRNQTLLVFVTLFSIVALVPMAQQGHAAGASGHDAAISSLGLHLVFAAVWLGGLLTIVAIRSTLDPARLGIIIGRYSTFALVSFVVVAISGYVNASLRVGTLDGLMKPYGILVLIKVGALLALGVFGAVQRRFLIKRMVRAVGRGTVVVTETAHSRYFWWLIAAELGFMGIASGVAAALARTDPLVPQVVITTTPAYILTGEALPPELTIARYFTEWKFDVIWVLVVAFLAFFYLAGVWRLHRRGDKWPIHRTVLWLAGLALLFSVTNGGLNVYEKYLFSVHMLAHMLLGMMIPVLLVPGAPVTLALRTIAKRLDGSRGSREWIMAFVHSKFAGVLANPIVSAVVFAASLWAFYYTPLFSWATTDHIGHQWMIAHFLATGYLFVQSLIGVDPVPYRAPYPLRLLLLLGTMAFHAFFGLALMTGTGLLLADWYGAMGRDWGPSAIIDQQTGGGIAWSVGEIPTITLAIIVAFMWAKSDTKDAKRLDRKADRDGDADLGDYNKMLAGLERRR